MPHIGAVHYDMDNLAGPHAVVRVDDSNSVTCVTASLKYQGALVTVFQLPGGALRGAGPLHYGAVTFSFLDLDLNEGDDAQLGGRRRALRGAR